MHPHWHAVTDIALNGPCTQCAEFDERALGSILDNAHVEFGALSASSLRGQPGQELLQGLVGPELAHERLLG